MKEMDKKFKPHKMYCPAKVVKSGKAKATNMANTFEQHLMFKKMGCGHTPIKKK
tara:strand:- start:1406 stop:1567 length:162 start_codon:yes stop_codon:yes gene_type:complete